MKRRDFLKLIGLAPIAPSVLAAKENSLSFKGIPLKYNKSLPKEKELTVIGIDKAFGQGQTVFLWSEVGDIKDWHNTWHYYWYDYEKDKWHRA